MATKYQKAVKTIEKLQTLIEANEQRDSEARQRIAAAEKALSSNEAAWKKALVDSDSKKVLSIETDIARLKSEILDRNNQLLEALQEEHDQLSAELEAEKAEAASLFSQNAAKILQRYAREFDDRSREVIRLGKSLITIHNLLREVGRGDIFRETLGPAVDVLGLFKVPIIEGFTLAEYNSRTQISTGNVYEEMRRLIEAA